MDTHPPDPTPTPDPAPLPAPSPRRFVRTRDDRQLGGVCGGLGRTFGLDPILFRLAFVGLALAGGAGIGVYLLACLVVPYDDGTPARGWSRVALVGGAIVVFFGVGGVIADGSWGFGLALVVLAAGTLLLVRHVRGDEGDDGTLRRLLIAAAAVAVGAVLLAGSAAATAFGGGTGVAVVVVTLGVAAIAGGVMGRRDLRWLAVPAVLLALPAGVVSAADVEVEGGVGERSYRPVADLRDEYRIGVGGLVVDLRGLDWRDGQERSVRVEAGMGEVTVIVPRDVCVGAIGHVGAGSISVLGREDEGFDVSPDSTDRLEVAARERPDSRRLLLEVDLGLGAVEVHHTRDPDGRDVDISGRDRFGEYDFEGIPSDEADELARAREACSGA